MGRTTEVGLMGWDESLLISADKTVAIVVFPDPGIPTKATMSLCGEEDEHLSSWDFARRAVAI